MLSLHDYISQIGRFVVFISICVLSGNSFQQAVAMGSKEIEWQQYVREQNQKTFLRSLKNEIRLAPTIEEKRAIKRQVPHNDSTLNENLLVHTEAFQVLDDGDFESDVYLQFGQTLAERLSFDRNAHHFSFTDDVFIDGNLIVQKQVTAQSLRATNLVDCPTLTTDALGYIQCGEAWQEPVSVSQGMNELLSFAPDVETTTRSFVFEATPSGSSVKIDAVEDTLGSGSDTSEFGDAEERSTIRFGTDIDSGKASITFSETGDNERESVSLYRDQPGVLRTDGSLSVRDQLNAGWLSVARNSFIVGAEGDLIVNEDQRFADLIARSRRNSHMLFVDASLDRVGIGTEEPTTELDVAGTTRTVDLQIDSLPSCTQIGTDGAGNLICQSAGSVGGGSFAQFVDDDGGANIGRLQPVAIRWGEEIRQDAAFSHLPFTQPSRVGLKKAGWYRVSYNISYNSNDNSANNILCQVRLNGARVIPYSTSYSHGEAGGTSISNGIVTYSRPSQLASEVRTNRAEFIVETRSDNEYYEVVCRSNGAATNVYTMPGESWTFVEAISGVK